MNIFALIAAAMTNWKSEVRGRKSEETNITALVGSGFSTNLHDTGFHLYWGCNEPP